MRVLYFGMKFVIIEPVIVNAEVIETRISGARLWIAKPGQDEFSSLLLAAKKGALL